MADQYIALGKFGSAWGIKGELKLHLYNTNSEILKKTRQLFYSKTGFSFEALELISLKKLPKMWVASFEKFTSPQAIHLLKDKEFFILKEQLNSSKKPEELYAYELKDFKVLNEESQVLGKVKNLVHYGASDLLEVVNEETREEQLIPFVKEYVVKLDRDSKVITVRWGNELE